MTSAYLLVSHGSRDPRPQVAAQHLARLVLQRLESRSRQRLREPRTQKTLLPIVGTTTLELAPIPLHQSLEQFALRATAKGFAEVQIVPLLLHRGVHVLEDIPAEVGLARQALGERIALQIAPHLGSYAGITQLVAAQFAKLNAPRRIVLAHGSRRLGGNQSVEAIAAQLDALPAYWSVTPSLAEQVERWVAAEAPGSSGAIAIVPYFLFAGGTTDAIALLVEQLQAQFPNTPLLLGQPLGATPELADAIAEGLMAIRAGQF